MNAESDRTGYYQNMSKWTGHSVRYLRMRTAVRLTLSALLVCVPFASILTSN